MTQTLINNNDFNGKYVTMEDFSNHAVISEGNTPQEAYEKALKKGHKSPVIAFVPAKGMVQIY
jgi:hypothetical protein